MAGSQPPAVRLVREQPLVVDGQQIVERFRIVAWTHFDRFLEAKFLTRILLEIFVYLAAFRCFSVSKTQ